MAVPEETIHFTFNSKFSQKDQHKYYATYTNDLVSLNGNGNNLQNFQFEITLPNIKRSQLIKFVKT